MVKTKAKSMMSMKSMIRQYAQNLLSISFSIIIAKRDAYTREDNGKSSTSSTSSISGRGHLFDGRLMGSHRQPVIFRSLRAHHVRHEVPTENLTKPDIATAPSIQTGQADG